jgi:allophanate hydrolase
MRGDGLPSSVTLIAPAGADGLVAGLAAAIHAASGALAGATGRPAANAPTAPASAPPGRIGLAVVGAHLSGLPLNPELVALGASFVGEVETAPDYRLYALARSKPAKPGLVRVADGEGAAIKAEVWALDPESFGAFVAKIPAPLGIGTIRLSDGSSVKGFLAEPEGLKGAARVGAVDRRGSRPDDRYPA